jgi:hypothetical protein
MCPNPTKKWAFAHWVGSTSNYSVALRCKGWVVWRRLKIGGENIGASGSGVSDFGGTKPNSHNWVWIVGLAGLAGHRPTPLAQLFASGIRPRPSASIAPIGVERRRPRLRSRRLLWKQVSFRRVARDLALVCRWHSYVVDHDHLDGAAPGFEAKPQLLRDCCENRRPIWG